MRCLIAEARYASHFMPPDLEWVVQSMNGLAYVRFVDMYIRRKLNRRTTLTMQNEKQVCRNHTTQDDLWHARCIAETAAGAGRWKELERCRWWLVRSSNEHCAYTIDGRCADPK